MPIDEDKQRKACPRRDSICIHHGVEIPGKRNTDIHLQGTTASRNSCIYPIHPYIYTKRVHLIQGIHLINIYKGKCKPREDIKSTHVDASCCITAASIVKFAKFDLTDSNVKKTSFRDWPYNWPEVSFHRCYLSAQPSRG